MKVTPSMRVQSQSGRIGTVQKLVQGNHGILIRVKWDSGYESRVRPKLLQPLSFLPRCNNVT